MTSPQFLPNNRKRVENIQKPLKRPVRFVRVAGTLPFFAGHFWCPKSGRKRIKTLKKRWSEETLRKPCENGKKPEKNSGPEKKEAHFKRLENAVAVSWAH